MRAVIIIPLLLMLSTCAHADEVQSVFTLDYVVELYRHEFAQIQGRIINFCRDLLFYLASIAFVTTGIKLILLQGDIKLFCYHMVRLMFTIGAVYFLIFNGPAISTDIVNSLVSLALDTPVSSTSGEFDGIDQLFAFTEFMAQSKILDQLASSELTFSSTAILALCGHVLIWASVIFMVIIFAVTYLNAYFNAVCGVLVVVLGVFGFTRAISLRYLFHTLAYGLKLFTLCLIYTIGTHIMNGLIADLSAIHELQGTLSLQYLGLILTLLLFILGLAVSMPNMVASLISNTCQTFSTNLYPSLRNYLKV